MVSGCKHNVGSFFISHRDVVVNLGANTMLVVLSISHRVVCLDAYTVLVVLSIGHRVW